MHVVLAAEAELFLAVVVEVGDVLHGGKGRRGARHDRHKHYAEDGLGNVHGDGFLFILVVGVSSYGDADLALEHLQQYPCKPALFDRPRADASREAAAQVVAEPLQLT